MEELLVKLYDYLTLAAITPKRSVCFHGGISQTIESIQELLIIPKPHAHILTIAETATRDKALEYYEQIRWNDPCEDQIEEFIVSERGYFCFNEDVVKRFLEKSKVHRIVRAHEAGRGGFMSIFGGKVLHVFSAEPYGGVISTGYVIHEQADGKTVLRDLDFNLVQEI